MAHSPVASADASSDSASLIDTLLTGASSAAVGSTASDFQISFNGMDLLPTLGNEATATTVAGQGGLAIAFGDGASATAEGGTGDFALADGTNALANAGSLTTGATGNNFDIAEDIGSNTAGGTGAPDGAFAGAGNLVAGGITSTGTDSNDTAIDFGNNGPTAGVDGVGGNDGAFAGAAGLIGVGGTAGNSDTAETFGNILGENDGAAAVGGNNNFADISGTETGTNEGPFAGLGNNNAAIADTNYTTNGDGVSAVGGDSNIAYVDGPDNSTAAAGGTSTAIGEPATMVGNHDFSYVADPFGTAPDTAVSGNGFSQDIAEVLFAHGNATADSANLLYDFFTLFGNFTGSL